MATEYKYIQNKYLARYIPLYFPTTWHIYFCNTSHKQKWSWTKSFEHWYTVKNITNHIRKNESALYVTFSICVPRKWGGSCIGSPEPQCSKAVPLTCARFPWRPPPPARPGWRMQTRLASPECCSESPRPRCCARSHHCSWPQVL